MKRRNFLAAAGATLFTPAILKAEGISLKLSHYLPPVHQVHGALVAWAEEVHQKTDGAVTIELFPAGQMGPAPRQFDLARTGVADFSYAFTALTPGRFPLVDLFGLPFLFSDSEGAALSSAKASFIGSSMKDRISEEMPGVEMLYAVVSTASSYFTKGVKLETPEDFAGLRLRSAGPTSAKQLELLGASPATIPPAETADAIAKGIVDGAVFNFEAGRVFQLHQSATHASTLSSTVGFFTFVANSDAFANLPADVRAVIEETTGPEAGQKIGAMYDAAEQEARDFMIGNGMEVLDLRGDKTTPFRDLFSNLSDEQIAAVQAKGKDAEGLITAVQQMVSV